MVVEVGLVGVQEVINGYRSPLVPRFLHLSQVVPILLIIVLVKDIILKYNTLYSLRHIRTVL